jgi:hypothetical protein
LQHWNEPEINVFPGGGNYYVAQGPVGMANCATVDAGNIYGGCAGQFGYLDIMDYGSNGAATSINHGFFFQDAWTIGRGLTVNAGQLTLAGATSSHPAWALPGMSSKMAG